MVDPSKTICADFSHGNTRKSRENAGKQCVAMCLTAVLHNQLKNIDEWDSSFLNGILCAGNSLYSCISTSINKPFLLLNDLPEMVSIFDKIYYLQYSNPFAGDLFMTSDNLPRYSLENALNNLFFDSQLNHQYCLLTIDCNTVAILKTSDKNFKIFDPHSRGLYGIVDPRGKCVLVSVEGINNLKIYFQNTVPQGNVPANTKRCGDVARWSYFMFSCRVYDRSDPRFVDPCDSHIIGVHSVSNRNSRMKLLPASSLKKRALVFPLETSSFLFLTILHQC